MSSHTKLFSYEAIFLNSILKAIFVLRTRLRKDSWFHTWPLSHGVCLVVHCQRFAKPRYVTAMPSSLGNRTNTKQVLTICSSDLKLNYHMYFLCKDKVSISNPLQQATDLFPWDPSDTRNYQKTAIKADRSSTWMVRDRVATFYLCPAHLMPYILKTSPVRRNSTDLLRGKET